MFSLLCMPGSLQLVCKRQVGNAPLFDEYLRMGPRLLQAMAAGESVLQLTAFCGDACHAVSIASSAGAEGLSHRQTGPLPVIVCGGSPASSMRDTPAAATGVLTPSRGQQQATPASAASAGGCAAEGSPAAASAPVGRPVVPRLKLPTSACSAGSRKNSLKRGGAKPGSGRHNSLDRGGAKPGSGRAGRIPRDGKAKDPEVGCSAWAPPYGDGFTGQVAVRHALNAGRQM